MGELISKFELLDPAGKQQLLDYLEFLLSKKEKKFDYEEYRKKILEVSVWSEEDVAVFDEIRQGFKNWKVKEW
ncbi:MAG: hypothetical protein DYG98_22685 [Haliscomenobacteraceae bacterium CHB4]|nr:hypothetical protein [Saprospiraceae bacterium]MCE7925867.1 hypothetical protein [Haliscomenobacteraceae bacterium CHB4]